METRLTASRGARGPARHRRPRSTAGGAWARRRLARARAALDTGTRRKTMTAARRRAGSRWKHKYLPCFVQTFAVSHSRSILCRFVLWQSGCLSKELHFFFSQESPDVKERKEKQYPLSGSDCFRMGALISWGPPLRSLENVARRTQVL